MAASVQPKTQPMNEPVTQYSHTTWTSTSSPHPFPRPDTKRRGELNRLTVRLMVNERFGNELDQLAVRAINQMKEEENEGC